ncbi:MAG TPA: glycogen debranching N-terminal domain-containing protein [Longimicrobiales bacterium]
MKPPGSAGGRGDAAAGPDRHGAGLNPHGPLDVVYQGYTVLVCQRDGSIGGGGREGLWDYDTRILSRHRILLAGEVPRFIGSGSPEAERWSAHLRVPLPGGTAAGPRLPQDALELVVTRRVGRGMRERLVVHNHSMVPADVELCIEVDADFADTQEAGAPQRPRGRIDRRWDDASATLVLEYRAERAGYAVHRALRLRLEQADSPPARDGMALRFRLRLPPRGLWSATLAFDSLVDGIWRTPLAEMPDGDTERDRARRRWREKRATLAASHPVVEGAFGQAAEDLFALRNWEYDRTPDAWFPMAGVPSYTGVFGRDALTAAWQGAVLGPEMLRGALDIVAATQAETDSAFHDREPGKLIHEMRRGPLSELAIIPQHAYYGTQTTPAMFVLALSELWHWTGDDGALRRYVDTALRTFDWARRYGDRDGDGFLEYVRRSPRGLKNHAWKDSDEAIRYPDGALVENPIATVEEQAYHYIALQRMAEILVALGDDARAADFLRSARRLRVRWDEAFWVDADGFYAMALDPDKRPVRSIGSNAGHALGAGIVPRERARAVADRLMAPDLFSGWGVRTLSAAHPSYNPLGYHLGTVWPVENATFALGFKRYGLDQHVERLATGMFAAAAHFHRLRLPEALGGHGAAESPIPTVYPGANSPQAWSAGAVVQLVQILLGLYPFAPARTLLLVRPRLPAWLEEVTLRGIRVGEARISLRFRREEDGHAAHEVLEREGTLHLLEPPPPDAVDDLGWLDRLEAWLLAHAPGRRARAARIALGDLDAL